jgi:hypothetical protein
MAIAEQVQNMKQQGINDSEIIKRLQEIGHSPLEINQAIEHSKIKEAVSNLNSELPDEQREEMNLNSGMQPSVMEAPQEQDYQEPIYQEQQQMPEQYYPQQQQNPYPQEEQYSQYQQYQTTNSENMVEITEQIFEEKIDKMRKKIVEMNSFGMVIDKKVKNIDERLKKIEEFIQELEIKIIGRIGSYGENLQDIKKEMEMMQDSFGKVINPLLDNAKKAHSKKSKKK